MSKQEKFQHLLTQLLNLAKEQMKDQPMLSMMLPAASQICQRWATNITEAQINDITKAMRDYADFIDLDSTVEFKKEV